ncbi:hypothetical protein FB550_103397 [Neobacillus bataviensis]|jgi:hypothetical protein|uniref:Uncharacterized protein n=1 Tax=Neobacillus bataviensis TaxID=220685 RepID=A0A561DPH3_9BACI|nr:hypothetical protein [Neobacillus bataviensis]TWE05219.1 hypothetical protein FB550_103397 [Neobacillus bataviensis]
MTFILGILALLITLLVIATILSIEAQLKKLNMTNKKILELLTELKKDDIK